MALPSSVLIVEDDPWMREDVARALAEGSSGFATVTAAADGRSALEHARSSLAFDAALVDLGLPDVPGRDLIAAMRTLRPSLTVVVFTVHDTAPAVLAALRAGARGYLLKSTPLDNVATLLREALDGGSPMTPAIARLVVEHTARIEPTDEEQIQTLTDREREVLGLLSRGHTYATVARALGVALGTIQAHVKSIYGKLEVSSKAEAAVIAARYGIG